MRLEGHVFQKVFDDKQAYRGEKLVIRSDVKVRFKNNTADQETLISYYAGSEHVLPDKVAMRHVEAGNAEYVTEEASQESPASDPDDKPSEAAPEAPQPPQKAKRSRGESSAS